MPIHISAKESFEATSCSCETATIMSRLINARRVPHIVKKKQISNSLLVLSRLGLALLYARHRKSWDTKNQSEGNR
jgi:hypothetical protein